MEREKTSGFISACETDLVFPIDSNRNGKIAAAPRRVKQNEKETSWSSIDDKLQMYLMSGGGKSDGHSPLFVMHLRFRRKKCLVSA